MEDTLTLDSAIRAGYQTGKGDVSVMTMNRKARFAGVLYLLVAITGGLASFLREDLMVSGDAAATIRRIIGSEWQFRISLVNDMLCLLFFIGLPLVLHQLFKSVNPNYAKLMVIFALIGVPIGLVSMMNPLAAELLLSGAEYLKAYDTPQLHAQVMFHLDFYAYGVSIAKIFWGLWLIPLGYLVYKSNFLPKIIGVLLMVGSTGYLLDTVKHVFVLRSEGWLTIFSGFQVLSIVGELSFLLWILLIGVKESR